MNINMLELERIESKDISLFKLIVLSKIYSILSKSEDDYNEETIKFFD